MSVNYTGLKDNPYYKLSTVQFGKYPGAMLTFDLPSQMCIRDRVIPVPAEDAEKSVSETGSAEQQQGVDRLFLHDVGDVLFFHQFAGDQLYE